VLSDYAMPGGTGIGMLLEAERQRLLDGTATLIVTAYPDARELANRAVIAKPLDLDLFLAQVKRMLNQTSSEPARPDGGTPSAHHHRVELALYLSSSSPASLQARRNLERVLERFEPSQIKCSVYDLGRDPLAGENDRVAFTPTLVKRYPAPRMWILGNLRETEIIDDLLRVCGVDEKK
jgi:circadian clock protein KaiB